MTHSFPTRRSSDLPAGGIDEAAPRHGAHRSMFAFPLSDEWNAWADMDKKPMRMMDFAAFLEDRIVDVLDMIDDEDSLPEDMQKFVNAVGGRIAGPSRLMDLRSEEHTSELQSLMRISYAVLWLQTKKQ